MSGAALSNAHKGGMLVPEPTMIETASGRFVDLRDPDPATIDPWDIAHALGMTCRYGGHVTRFYSVAEHAILVADLLEHQGCQLGMLRTALLHDAAEAYLGDVVSPLKYALRAAEFDYPGAVHRASCLNDFTGAYAHLTSDIERAICARFDAVGGIEPDGFDHEDIRLADMWALAIEARALTRSHGANWRWPGELPEEGELPAGVGWAGGLGPERAAARLFGRFEEVGIA